jgi:hypothetical protein
VTFRRGPCALAGLCLLACASRAPAPAQPRVAARLEAGQPFAERDRPHFTPLPRSGPAQDPHALRTRGDDEQARDLAMAMVRALVHADELALRDLLDERLVHALEGSQRARTEWIERCVKDARALAYGIVPEAEALVDLDAIVVRTAALHHKDVPLPGGLEPSDLVVTLPPRSLSRDGTRSLQCLTGIYVRPGPSPRIVGVMR